MGSGLPLQGEIADCTYRSCGESHRTAVLGVHPWASTVHIRSADISSRHTLAEDTLFCQTADERIMQWRMSSITYCVMAVLTGGIQLLSVSQPSSSAVSKKETASDNITRLILASLHWRYKQESLRKVGLRFRTEGGNHSPMMETDKLSETWYFYSELKRGIIF